MRAIDADEVFKAAYDMACQSVLIPGCEDYAHGLREAANYIENAPTLDVAPVRHGHWAEKKLGLVCREVVCSECEQLPIKTGSCSYWMGDYAPRYCPNCGAKMDAGQEDDENA